MKDLPRLSTVAVAVGVLLVAAGVGFQRQFTSAFPLHVVLGNELIEHGRLYTHDLHSYTAAGNAVFNTSWLSDALLALGFRLGGYSGAFALRALALIAVAACLMRESNRRGVSPAVAGLLTLCLLTYCAFVISLGPEMFGFALLAGLLLALGAHQRTRDARYLAIPALLFLFWPNLDATVWIGLLVFGLYSAQWLVEELRKGRGLLDRRAALTAGFAPPVAFLLACANPHGLWLPLSFTRMQPCHTAAFRDHAPSTLLDISVLPELALLVVAATTVGALLVNRRTSPWHLISVLVLAWAAHHCRGCAVFGLIVATPLVASNLAGLRAALGRRARARLWRRLGAALAVAAAAWCLGMLLSERRLLQHVGSAEGSETPAFPAAACRFLADRGAPAPVFDSYEYGAYLMSCLGKRYPLAIDQRGRALYSEEFLRRYADAAASPAALRAFLKDYPATWALVAYDSFASALSASREQWALIYFDDLAQIFASRADPRVRRTIAANEFRLLGPSRLAAITELPASSLPEARAELARQVAQCRSCVRTAQMQAALALASRNERAYLAAMRALRTGRETSEVDYLAARHALAGGDFAAAEALFARFRSLGGDELTPLLATARALARRGELDRALELLAEGADLPGAGPAIERARAEIERARSQPR